MWFLVLVACVTETPLVGETLTDGGTWRLALDSTAYDQGASDIAFSAVQAASDEWAEGLSTTLRPDMNEMGEVGQLVDLVETEPGVYAGTVSFDMPGLWSLTGYLSDGNLAESYLFIVEVQP